MRVMVTRYIKVHDYKTHGFYADILILTLRLGVIVGELSGRCLAAVPPVAGYVIRTCRPTGPRAGGLY